VTRLRTGSTLHIYSVKGCGGAFHDGDTAALSGTSMIAPVQTITGPWHGGVCQAPACSGRLRGRLRGPWQARGMTGPVPTGRGARTPATR